MRVAILGGGNLLLELGISYNETECETPFGSPSASLRTGIYRDIEVMTMLRHGGKHETPAHRVNARANIDALADRNPDVILAVSVAGSLGGGLNAGDLAIFNQILDFSGRADSTFHDNGPVTHPVVTHPTCKMLSEWCYKQLPTNIHARLGGVMTVIRGPRFATQAESAMYKILGGEFINMSSAPEAFLARERGLCYVPIALITDSDNFDPDEELSLNTITKNIKAHKHVVPCAVSSILDAIADQGLPECPSCHRTGSPINIEHLNI